MSVQVDPAEARDTRLAGFASDVDVMFYAKENGPPWHKNNPLNPTGDRAREVETALTGPEALTAAGLDWEVELRPVYANVGGRQVKLLNNRAVVRTDLAMSDPERAALAVVGSSYQVFQNSVLEDFLSTLFGMGLRYETGGSLFGGRKVWLLARMPEEVSIGSDQVFPYVLLSSGHDGRCQLRVQPTAIRAVCWNTVRATIFSSDAEVRRLTVGIRHVGDVKAKVGQAREILGISLEALKRFETAGNALLAVDGMPHVDALIEHLFPETEKQQKAREERVEEFRAILSAEADRSGSSRPTGYDLLNAVTGFADHVRAVKNTRGGKYGDKADARMYSVFDGGAAAMKDRGLEWLLDLDELKASLDAQKVLVRTGR